MGNLVVWIVIFAGATLGLLAIFLLASERELQAELDKSTKSGTDPIAETTCVSLSDGNGEPAPAATQESKTESTDPAEPEAECGELTTTPASVDAKDTELATIRREIAEQTRINTELKDDNLRLREEIFELRSRLARMGDGQAETSLLNGTAAQPTELLSAQSGAGDACAENHATPSALTGVAVSGLMTASTDPIDGPGEVPLVSLMPAVAGNMLSERKASSKRGKLVAMAIFVLALGILATQAWRLDPAQRHKPQTLANQSMPNARRISAESKTTAGMAATLTIPRERRQAITHPAGVSLSQSTRKSPARGKTNTARPAAASYEIVYPSQVFSEPNEASQSVAQVETGMDVYVVNAQNGWLEIRSKHGRPPGFIKKEIAVLIREH